MTRAKLALVPAEAETVDIYAAWRAEIGARDWPRVHVAGDRSEAIDLPPARKSGWRK